MAGCLIVRNSPLGVAFVSQWLAYNSPKPAGFSSSDNGALHLAVLRLLRPENPETIERAKDYYALTSSSSNLKPYFDWVQDTCSLWGDPAVFKVAGTKPKYIEKVEVGVGRLHT